MSAVEWHPWPEHAPPPDVWYPSHSCDVLISDGKKVYIGYLVKSDEPELWRDAWRLQGRDSYAIDGITHWAELPNLPE